ncbi:prefoldin, alpha subunit [Spizellomyces punctatus DAOM BR117]|uniref:Prefoldin, alpha subunit n=1 Tax=Spizellomyces punctatus (strain DAOM BR117) TaxID=645134 RepID=A0A0L0H4T5_SPIPD|nr:prefoldin, alpha subunit [Spizellomyces punctatus DAOM BR117]KNC96217.1 prefoldin, alpha subunit [Spizellomyces punctatus DAOM BR117]|eukprot:XP_016604257.1 prefoldin, alpha subunit [Spizellomyces punctatus DAOM BR117]
MTVMVKLPVRLSSLNTERDHQIEHDRIQHTMSQQQQQIDPMQIPLPQLKAMHNTIGEEIETFTNSFAQLKQVHAKYNDCMESLGYMTPKSEGKTLLVPLTSSLYVPGELADLENVILDVGTGYYIEKPIPEAKDYYKRKIEYVKSNLDKLQETINDRRKRYGDLTDLINLRVALLQKEQGQAGKAQA